MSASIFAFAVLVAYWPGILSAGTAPRWGLLAVGIPLIARLNRTVFPWALANLMLAGVAYIAIGLGLYGFPFDGEYEFFHFLILAGVVIAASGIEDIETILVYATLGIWVSALIGIGQVFGWMPVDAFNVPAGLFINRDILAETAAPLLVWALLRKRYWLAIGPAIPVMLCQSRSAVLMVGIGLCWGLLRSPKRMIIAALICAPIAVLISLEANKWASLEDRLVIWQATVSGITLFGHGIGSFSTAHPFWQFSHSDVLQALYELGIGVIPFIALVGMLVFGKAVTWEAHDEMPERAAFVALLVGAAVSWVLHLPATGFLAALLCGHLVRRRGMVRHLQHVVRTAIDSHHERLRPLGSRTA